MRKKIEHCKVVAIVGLAKNTGKTTTLNALMRMFSRETLALTSIGLDGEDLDQVTFLPKPRIHAVKGMIIATAKQCLGATPCAATVLEETPHQTALGPIVIIRAEEDGYFLVAGPTTNSALEDVIRRLQTRAAKVFVDGAFNRRTFASMPRVSGIVIATGASYSPDMEATVAETAHLAKLLQAPVHPPIATGAETRILIISEQETRALKGKRTEGLLAHRSVLENRLCALYVRGAVTQRIARFLIHRRLHDFALVADDAGKFLYGRKEAEHMRKLNILPHVLKTVPLLAITVNPFSPHGEHYPETAFMNALMRAIPDIPIYNVLKRSDCDVDTE